MPARPQGSQPQLNPLRPTWTQILSDANIPDSPGRTQAIEEAIKFTKLKQSWKKKKRGN